MHEASARSAVLGATVSRPGFMIGTSMAIVLVCVVPRLALGIIFAVVVLPEHPVCPRDALLRSFGWLRKRDSAEILGYMARVQQSR